MYIISLVRNSDSTLFLSDTDLLNLKVIYLHDSIDFVIKELSYLLKLNIDTLDSVKNAILNNGYDTVVSPECFYTILDMNYTPSDEYIKYIYERCKLIVRENSINTIIKKENQNDSLFKNK